MYKIILPFICMLTGIVLMTLSACAGPVITESSFRGRCLTFSPGSMMDGGYSCGDQPSICDEYVHVIDQEYDSRQDCINACTAKYDVLFRNDIGSDCTPTIRYGRDNCKNYCRAHYQ